MATRWLALSWTIIIFILLSIPGSVIPKEPVFVIPQLDKIVHIVLFGGFVWLWCYYYQARPAALQQLIRRFFYIFVAAAVYGIGMEYVQKYFIPLRDFDEADIIADLIGASLSYGLCNLRLLKPGR